MIGVRCPCSGKTHISSFCKHASEFYTQEMVKGFGITFTRCVWRKKKKCNLNNIPETVVESKKEKRTFWFSPDFLLSPNLTQF